ncbi:MAG: MarR family transcriptional regulator [Rubrobacteraceae bacterium]|nr:MarR family transcriptional regulator [Rubrobacteraceae bacterium]
MSKRREELLRGFEEENRKSTLDGVFFFQAVAERSGMNLTDLQCVAILTSTGPTTAGQLAETMGLTTGAITGLLNRMERAGYVRREKDPGDGRRVVIRPVKEALERAGAGLFGGQGEALEDLLSGYDDRDLALLLDFVQKANDATREEIGRIRAASHGDEGGEFSASLGAVETGRLVFANGASRLVLRADAGMDGLYRASFEGPAPKVKVEGGAVTFRYRQRFGGLFDWRDRSGEVRLNPAIPWRIEVRGGAFEVAAELGGLDLAGLEIRGGASTFRVNLPEPSGTVPVRISGGASEIVIRRPPYVAARVRLKGWASQLTFDDESFSSMGSDVRLQSPGYEDATRRYDVEISGSASDVALTTTPG